MASIRRMSPLARVRPGSPASSVVVAAADDQVPGRGLGALGDPDVAAVVDQAEVDQVVADPGGQFPAAGPVRGHQQDVAAGQVAGHVGVGGLVHGLVGRGAADAAVLVVLVQRGGVPVAQPQRGGAFPGGGEPDRFGELDVAEPVGEQRHGAAAFDGGELLLVPGQHQLAAVAGRVAGNRGQVGHGDHRALVGQDQRAGRDPACGEVGEQPGGVRGDLDAGGAEFVGGVLGGGGAEHRAVPGPRGGGQDAGLAGAGRAGDHLDGAGRGEDVPDGGGLVQPQPARRGMLARVVRAAAQLRLEQRAGPRRGARAASSPGSRGAPCACACATSLFFQGQLRGGGVPRGAGPRVDAAPVQLAAQRRGQRRPFGGLQAHHVAGPAGQGLLGQAEQQLLGGVRVHLPGLRRHDQGELLEQVVPGPGGLLGRHQGEGLGQRPRLRLARGRRGRRAAAVMLVRLCVRAARVRDRGRDAGQLAAERGVPPRGQRVPVDRRPRPCRCARLQRGVVWRCAAARASSARGRACAPTPARARVPSRAPARCAWSRRPSAPA